MCIRDRNSLQALGTLAPPRTLRLEPEIYQLAFEYHALEFLQDSTAAGYMEELTATIDNTTTDMGEVIREIDEQALAPTDLAVINAGRR